MKYENERTEFKSQVTDDIYKEVIAFANTDGGEILVGVDDRGNAVGLDDADGDCTRLTNGIRDAIQPDVTMFVRYVLQENRVLRIEVGEGSYKPYYLKGKGLKPSGVFVRQGASSVPASPDLIRRMIRDSDGGIFEEMRTPEQGLTFTEAEAAFARYGVDFGEDKFAALGIRSLHDGAYTNLGLICSDQCRHTVKAAVFGDSGNTVFRDSREFGGSIFRQLDETYSYLSLCNRTTAVFEGLERIEKKDYPDEALREALLNALVHRDYSFSGSIIINVNDDGMEFISIGGLVPGLTAEDIRSGISQPRNRRLAEIFHRLKLIESYGTGIRRIYALYADCPGQPEITVTPNVFTLFLPNMNTAIERAEKEKTARPDDATPQMRAGLDYLAAHGEMSEADAESLLGVKKTRVYVLTKEMSERGLIEIVGRGAGKRFRRI